VFIVAACKIHLIVCIDCTIRWTRKENTSAAVLGDVDFIGWMEEMECKAYCLKSPRCVAIHVHGSLACLLIYNADVFANTFFQAGVTLLILHPDCPPISPLSTEGSLRSTASVGNATGMFY